MSKILYEYDRIFICVKMFTNVTLWADALKSWACKVLPGADTFLLIQVFTRSLEIQQISSKIRNFTKNPMFFENPKILPKSEISPTFNIFLKIKKKPKSEMFSQSPKFFPKSEIFPKIQFLKFV